MINELIRRTKNALKEKKQKSTPSIVNILCLKYSYFHKINPKLKSFARF